ELYTSMQTGVIDATEWVGPYNDRSFGLNEVGEYYYTPGWHEPQAMMEFIVNMNAWNRLPEDLQAIVRVAADAVNADMLAEYTARNALALRELRAEGIEPQPLPNDVLAELKRHALDYYEEESARNEDFARIYQQYTGFQQMVSEWLVLSEKATFDYREALEHIE
ncbi:MAG: ABC transporter substrate-binding protein, partial [Pseudohongiellaceae bacterium]